MHNVEEQAKAIQELRKGIIKKAHVICKKNLEHQMLLECNEVPYSIHTIVGCHSLIEVYIIDMNKDNTLFSESIYVFDYFNSSRCSMERIMENATVISANIDRIKKEVEKYIKLNLKAIDQ